MPRATSRDGTMIAYDWTGQGPAVILVDGAFAHRAYMGGRPLAEQLAADFTVIAYDRRGRGESSDTHPYAVDREIEDIEALIDGVGSPVFLYGFSSGAVLALRAAARLGARVGRLAVLEPPFNASDDHPKSEFFEYRTRMAELLEAGKHGEVVAFFLQDMVPPDVLEDLRQTPAWTAMTAVAPTLAYDHEVMGDGAVPAEAADVRVPTLILDGGESADFKHVAADALAAVMPQAQRQTLHGQVTTVPAEVLAPILKRFFAGRDRLARAEARLSMLRPLFRRTGRGVLEGHAL